MQCWSSSPQNTHPPIPFVFPGAFPNYYFALPLHTTTSLFIFLIDLLH